MTANLRNLQQQIQRDDLAGDMASSYRALRNGWLDSAQRLEEEILDDLANLDESRRALAQSLPVTEEEALASTLREIQDLQDQIRSLESGAERLRGSDPRVTTVASKPACRARFPGPGAAARPYAARGRRRYAAGLVGGAERALTRRPNRRAA